MAADNGGLNYWPKAIYGYPRDPWLIKFGLHFSLLFIVYYMIMLFITMTPVKIPPNLPDIVSLPKI
jgi:hypothetical protein